MSENKIGKKKHSKIKIASIVVAVLVAVFLLGTLLMNVIPKGFCVGVVVDHKYYRTSMSQWERENGMYGGRLSGYRNTVVGLGGIRTFDFSYYKRADTWNAIMRKLDENCCVRDVYLGDLVVFSYDGNYVTKVYDTYNISPLTFLPTHPYACVFFISLMVAGVMYLILVRKVKKPRLLTVVLSAASVVISVVACMFFYKTDFFRTKGFIKFMYYHATPNYYRATWSCSETPGKYVYNTFNWIIVVVAGLAFWFLAYLYAKNRDNEEKSKKQKSLLTVYTVCALLVLVSYFSFCWQRASTYYEPEDSGQRVGAPVIYLYPEEETDINVKLDLDGEFTCTYPKYDDSEGWNCTALPNGMLTDEDGKEYTYLYWEADLDFTPDFSEGFCVKGEDTAEFLEEALTELGLNVSERNTFIMYWLPQMEANEYNLVSFQTSTYDNAAELNVIPEPDTVIRVNMAWYGVENYVEIEPQELASFNPSEREGFTLVEWGGEIIGE